MEIDTGSFHPNPHPDLHHRKIELQSPLDLTYLQSNLATSARQKLDLHFPPSALRSHQLKLQPQPATVISLDGPTNRVASSTSQKNGSSHTETSSNVDQGQAYGKREDNEDEEDPFRQRVRLLVDAFLSRTWTAASSNISINGLDASSFPTALAPASSSSNHIASPSSLGESITQEREGVDFTYESYDGRLQSKLASLYGEMEALTAQVSKLRREAPQRGAEMYQTTLSEGLVKNDEIFSEETQRQQQQQSDSDNILKLDNPRKGWHQDVQEMYERGVGELVRLSGGNISTSIDPQGGGGGGGSGGGSLTETVGKVQRARTVAMELE